MTTSIPIKDLSSVRSAFTQYDGPGPSPFGQRLAPNKITCSEHMHGMGRGDLLIAIGAARTIAVLLLPKAYSMSNASIDTLIKRQKK